MKKISVLSLLTILLSINVNAINLNIMPDNLLYGFDNALDQFSLVLSIRSFNRAENGLLIINERLTEIQELIKNKKFDSASITIDSTKELFYETLFIIKDLNKNEKEKLDSSLRKTYLNLLNINDEIKSLNIESLNKEDKEKLSLISEQNQKLIVDIKDLLMPKKNLEISVELYEKEKTSDVVIEKDNEVIEFSLNTIDINFIINSILKKLKINKDEILDVIDIEVEDLEETRAEAEKRIIKANEEIVNTRKKIKFRDKKEKDTYGQKIILNDAELKINQAKEAFAKGLFKKSRDLAVEAEKFAEKSSDVKIGKEISKNKIDLRGENVNKGN